MIIIFTSNTDGGIVQLAIQLTSELEKINVPCRCFLPRGAVGIIPESKQKCFRYYERFRAISQYDKRVTELADILQTEEPNIIWYVDSSILSAELCICLSRKMKKSVLQLFTVHDPTQDHPTNQKVTMRARMKRILFRKMQSSAFDICDNIVLLSPESTNQFRKTYPKYSDKAIVFNLGAHIPDVEEKRPIECVEVNAPYILFFGRIDRYKGLNNLLCAFINRRNKQLKLVVAGKGKLSDEEEQIADKMHNVLLLNRYIKDEEQIWLFRHAKALVLPYIEASQSGIIPIAYKFGVPVITTNIPGLTQFVEHRKTGMICNSVEDITDAIDCLDSYAGDMRESCLNYYNDNLAWERSIRGLLSKLNYVLEAANE